MKQHTLWVEKYRSQILDDYVGNESIKDLIQDCIDKNDIPHMIFSGPPGTGKTTLAKLIVNSIECDYLYINATDERSMDVMRDKVKGFASSASFKPLKVVILDEADFIRIDSQALLRNVIETFSLNTRFILTCNYIERIIDPIQSRCQVLNIVPPSKKDIATHVAIILEKEQIEYKAEDLVKIVTKFYPDLRKTLSTCQILSKDSKLVLDEKVLISGNYKELILKELKSPSSKSFNHIRQIIADSQLNEFDEIYKFLFENIDEFAKNHVGEIIVLLEEYLFHANFKIDKEINLLALIYKILSLIC
jgi:DNA polymerase III delta prime subunit